MNFSIFSSYYSRLSETFLHLYSFLLFSFPFWPLRGKKGKEKRKLVVGKPSKKGLYIHKGEGKTEKVII